MNHEYIEEIAGRIGISPQAVVQVIKSPTNVRTPDTQQILAELVNDGHGVFICLLYKRTHQVPSQRPMVVDDYTGNIILSLYQRARALDYNLDYYVANEAVADHDYYEWLIQQNPGAGLVSIIPINTQTISEVYQHYPYVLIDYQGNEDISGSYTISVDNYGGIIQAMQHLFELGHRRIGFITGVLSMSSAQERLQGYQEALRRAGIPFDPALVVEGNWRSEEANQLTVRLLQQTPPITAIVASNDMMALGAMMAINDQGLQVPTDISLVGFDDIAITTHVTPQITTIRQPIVEMGTKAADLIVELLEGHKPQPEHYCFPVELVIRQSTAVSVR